MTPTKLLIGQIAVVFAIVVSSVWAATQWCAHMLGHQPPLGAPWFVAAGWPIYKPWKVFEWWFHFDAYAPEVFDKAGVLAGAITVGNVGPFGCPFGRPVLITIRPSG